LVFEHPDSKSPIKRESESILETRVNMDRNDPYYDGFTAPNTLVE